MSGADTELVSIGCDYITGVTLDKDSSESLHAVATSLFRVERDFGNEPRSWGMAGFKGWSCGHVQLGSRDDEFICRLSSNAAQRSWRTVAERSSNVTRFDVQATVKFPLGPTREINRVKRSALRHSKKHDDVPIVRWIADNRGGYTLYLGSRESNVFARVYDKHARDKEAHWLQCVRYEVQFNSRLAGFVANTMKCQSSPIPEFAGHVLQFFDARDCKLELPYAGQLTFCCPRNASDADRKLLWLAESVKPSVLSLIACGRGEETLRALGLIDDAESSAVHMGQTRLDKGE